MNKEPDVTRPDARQADRTTTAARRGAGMGRARRRGRRGVASVLAMMFLVLFGALSVAMAVASQGNLRTAQTHLHVVRAMSAAETGMDVATQRLQEAVGRFVVSKGVVDRGFGSRLWEGTTTGADGRVTVLAAPSGRTDARTVRGIADAVVCAHAYDANLILAPGFPAAAQDYTPSNVDSSVYSTRAWVRTPLVGIDADTSVRGAKASAYQITYAPLANGTDVRVIVTGYSSIGADGTGFAASADAATRVVSRTIQQDVRVAKRPRHAMISPSRIMIGKNVLVTGPLGTTYTDVTQVNGDPIETRGDFDGLNNTLDAKLARFRAACKQYDVDGDNRLRVGHPVESQGLPGAAEMAAKGWAPNSFSDATKDGYVDEFDIFINHFDVNRDGDVVLSARLTAGTPNAGRTPEFTADDDLALLIDNANPDRNANGVYGFTDANDNNRITPASAPRDPGDRTLGWRDGVINYKDNYAKVRGRLMFRGSSSAWASARGGSYADLLDGPFIPPRGQTATRFGATTDELPDLDQNSFSSAQTPLAQAANGQGFAQQVAAQLGVSASSLATYVEAKTDASQPRYWRGDLDDAYVYARTGMHLYEKMPFNAPSYSDWYYRPRYENMTFKNVQIPMGCNALFVNCTFVGVTYVRSYTDNTHANWTLYGRLQWDGAAGKPVAGTAPLDKSDFLRYTTGNVADGPANYSSFPDPPVINGATKTGAARDTKLYSNNLRFHGCLFVGSVVSDTPSVFTNVRNKLQFTGATRFSTQNPNSTSAALNPDPDALPEIEKSSLMAPNYSVDIGSFNAPTDAYVGAGAPAAQNVQLRGSIVAGVLDIRGSARIDGAMFMTFAPVAGQAPLVQNGQPVGNPANFNCTLGYFGSEAGDAESMDPSTLPLVNGVRCAGYDTNGDGIPDVNADQPQPPGSTPVPFYGYGRVELNYNPDLPMPDGIMLPLSAVVQKTTYREGKVQ